MSCGRRLSVHDPLLVAALGVPDDGLARLGSIPTLEQALAPTPETPRVSDAAADARHATEDASRVELTAGDLMKLMARDMELVPVPVPARKPPQRRTR